MKSRTSTIVVVFVLTVAFFAAAFPAIRAAETGFSPSSIVLLRAILATAGLAVLAVIMQVSLRMPWRDLLLAALIGQLGISMFQWVLNSAIALTSTGVASTLVNTAPLISLLLSAIFLREVIPVLRWVGVGISFIGIYLLGTSDGVTSPLGVLLLIIAAVSLGTYSVALKPLLRRQHPLAVTFHGTWPGIILFAWATPQVLTEVDTAPTSAWVGVFVLAIVVTCGAYVLLARLLQLLPVSRVALYYYLVPPVAIGYSMILFDEIPTAREVFGVVIAIAGVALALSAKAPQAKTPLAR